MLFLGGELNSCVNFGTACVDSLFVFYFTQCDHRCENVLTLITKKISHELNIKKNEPFKKNRK